MKFDFASVVEQLCSKVGLRKKNDSGGLGQYKHKEKWQKLAANLPQAVLNCVQGNKFTANRSQFQISLFVFFFSEMGV